MRTEEQALKIINEAFAILDDLRQNPPNLWFNLTIDSPVVLMEKLDVNAAQATKLRHMWTRERFLN